MERTNRNILMFDARRMNQRVCRQWDQVNEKHAGTTETKGA